MCCLHALSAKLDNHDPRRIVICKRLKRRCRGRPQSAARPSARPDGPRPSPRQERRCSAGCPNNGSQMSTQGSTSFEQSALRHVVGGQHLYEEFGGRSGESTDVFGASVPQHFQQDLVMDPGQVEDTYPCCDGVSAELVTPVERDFLSSWQISQEGRSVIAGQRVELSHEYGSPSRPSPARGGQLGC